MSLSRHYDSIVGLIEGLTAAKNLALVDVTVTTVFSPSGETFGEKRTYVLDVAERHTADLDALVYELATEAK